MKFLHLADLHFGKRVNDISMLEDQNYILHQILALIDCEDLDGVLICGDLYDKQVPSTAAVELCDWFFSALQEKNQKIYLISGNHDSAERLHFGSSLMEPAGMHVSGVFKEAPRPIVLEDEYGPLNLYLLPFIKPAHVRAAYPGVQGLQTYQDALSYVVGAMNVNAAERNVLLAHQLVTAGGEELIRSDSEEISIGGLDNVDADTFAAFDYVALGHIHRPQRVGRDTVRYAGTPLKYSFSEANHKKSVTIVELKEKGDVQIRQVPLIPKHDMREIRGTYEELMSPDFYLDMPAEDYLHVILTDEQEIPNVMNLLRTVYPNIMRLTYDNTRTRMTQTIATTVDAETKNPLTLFEELYELQNNEPMTEAHIALVKGLMEGIWEGDA